MHALLPTDRGVNDVNCETLKIRRVMICWNFLMMTHEDILLLFLEKHEGMRGRKIMLE